jgi:hypothetical protein
MLNKANTKTYQNTDEKDNSAPTSDAGESQRNPGKEK